MVVIPAGRIHDGIARAEKGRYDDEGPQHKVTIARSFAVSKFDVTFADWDACVSVWRLPASCTILAWDGARQPVINVTWDDAQHYVAWLSRDDRPALSAAHGGRMGICGSRRHHDGLFLGRRNRQEATRIATGVAASGTTETSPVGSFNPNAFGLYDMAGNVFEWVEDCYHGITTERLRMVRRGPAEIASSRVVRGGSWGNLPVNLSLREPQQGQFSRRPESTFSGFGSPGRLFPLESLRPGAGIKIDIAEAV